MTLKRRWLPRPLLSGSLLLSWLVLVGSLAPAHILLAGVSAVLLPLLLQQFLVAVPPVRKPLMLLRFFLLVVADIVRANIQVARWTLGPNKRLQPVFIEMPLLIRDQFATTLLMSIITLTPGTLAARLSSDGGTLLIHALHSDDPIALVAQLKQRYEQPLREIFAC